MQFALLPVCESVVNDSQPQVVALPSQSLMVACVAENIRVHVLWEVPYYGATKMTYLNLQNYS